MEKKYIRNQISNLIDQMMKVTDGEEKSKLEGKLLELENYLEINGDHNDFKEFVVKNNNFVPFHGLNQSLPENICPGCGNKKEQEKVLCEICFKAVQI